jgi:hypothetical protein
MTDESQDVRIYRMRLPGSSPRAIADDERRAAMLGTDAPRTVDAVQLTQVTGPQLTSTERIRVVLDQLMDRTYRTIDGEVIKGDGDG